MRIWRGSPYPLGATWDGAGVNVAIFSEHASRMELCLFDSPDAKEEAECIALPEKTYQVWHGFFPDLRPGQLYGQSDRHGALPLRGRVFTPADICATVYHCLGIDPQSEVSDALGRPLRISDGRPMIELF